MKRVSRFTGRVPTLGRRVLLPFSLFPYCPWWRVEAEVSTHVPFWLSLTREEALFLAERSPAVPLYGFESPETGSSEIAPPETFSPHGFFTRVLTLGETFCSHLFSCSPGCLSFSAGDCQLFVTRAIFVVGFLFFLFRPAKPEAFQIGVDAASNFWWDRSRRGLW